MYVVFATLPFTPCSVCSCSHVSTIVNRVVRTTLFHERNYTLIPTSPGLFISVIQNAALVNNLQYYCILYSVPKHAIAIGL